MTSSGKVVAVSLGGIALAGIASILLVVMQGKKRRTSVRPVPHMPRPPFGLTVPRWNRDYSPKEPAPSPRNCFKKKADALNVFKDYNQHVLQTRGGGLYDKDTSGGFDAINERYGLTGKQKVVTMAEALWVAMPARSPYCLDRMDVRTLNELPVVAEAGGFRLPDFVHESGADEREDAYYRGLQRVSSGRR